MQSRFDFDKNLEFLTNTSVDTSKTIKQNAVLNSDNYNKTFQCIEESLNLLYEKTRTIQNLIDYSNTFIKNEINESIIECKSLLDNIETNRDLMKDSAYIKYNIKLQSIFDTYSDRNNTPIKGVDMHNGVITLNSNTIEDIEITNVSLESKNINCNILNTKQDIINSKCYRSFYMFDRMQKDPVREKITLNFSKIRTINKINLTASNCKIISIEYLLENGQTEIVENYEVNIIKNRNVKSAIVTIESNNYMISQINYNEVKNEDFWDIINKIKNDDNSFIEMKKYYYYLFGLDDIQIQFIEKADSSCFISKEIKIDKLKENEYISLTSEYSCERGSIEYYIIDGTTEIAILPEEEKTVSHEKVFYKVPTRFSIDDVKTVKVYKDNVPVKISISEAMNSTSEDYTVSYAPKNSVAIDSILSNVIKVKAIIRNYDNNYIPYIKSIQVKKYGGGSLWISK